MLASLITLLAYSALTLAQLQHWKSDHSSAWSTAESSSSATTFTTAFPASATTSGWTENTHGGNDYTAGLVAALNVNGLTVLASLVETSGDAVYGLLEGGNKTLFAPSDSALNSLAVTASSLGFTLDSRDAAALDALLSYHIVPRPIDPAFMFPEEPSIFETELTYPRWVQLSNSAPQVLVLLPTSPPSDQFVIQRDLVNTTTLSSFSYQNLVIRRIDSVLIPPPSLSTVLGVPTPEVNLSAFGNAQPSELSSLVNSTGITLFAPGNGAIENALASGQLSNHTRAQVVNVIANHFVQPGTVLYSTNLTDGSYTTSASGEQLNFINNGTGRFVVSNGTTARLIRENVIVSNGVVHVIEEVLYNTAGSVASVPSTTANYSVTGSAPTTAIIATSSLASTTPETPTETPTETASSVLSSATSIFTSFTSAVESAPPSRKIRRSRLAPLVV